MIRIAQALLVAAAATLWAASRLTWVEVHSFDGLGQPKTAALSGASWSTALVPLALLLVAAAVAALAVRGWPLRVLALLVAVASAGMAYLAVSLWVIHDIAVRAANLAEVPVADLIGTQRHYVGAAVTLAAALGALIGAVLLMRSAAKARAGVAKYASPAVRRQAAGPRDDAAAVLSERAIWDALDEGHDPTGPDNKGR